MSTRLILVSQGCLSPFLYFSRLLQWVPVLYLFFLLDRGDSTPVVTLYDLMSKPFLILLLTNGRLGVVFCSYNAGLPRGQKNLYSALDRRISILLFLLLEPVCKEFVEKTI